MNSDNKTLGWISLFVALGGLIIPFLLMTVSTPLRDFLWINGPYVIWGFELLALILGILARRAATGKAGIIASILISLFLVLY
ncbi:MAG TPA: hypothetical protein VK400_11865, partial [Pyrinomonadaceae bacterium]|nr:hypothetical protein [Pyrinomonadaceae bacterium]